MQLVLTSLCCLLWLLVVSSEDPLEKRSVAVSPTHGEVEETWRKLFSQPTLVQGK
jgi:hypothetical protein